jgi:hypothetical protein
MASEGNLTIYDIEKVDDCDYDKELPEGEISQEPTDFPEGGLRGWMTLVGRFDYMNRELTGFDEGL